MTGSTTFARGRTLLLLSIGLDITLPFVIQRWHGHVDDQLVEAVLTAAVDAYLLAYLLVARRVRDTFLDFSPPLEVAKPAGQ